MSLLLFALGLILGGGAVFLFLKARFIQPLRSEINDLTSINQRLATSANERAELVENYQEATEVYLQKVVSLEKENQKLRLSQTEPKTKKTRDVNRGISAPLKKLRPGYFNKMSTLAPGLTRS